MSAKKWLWIQAQLTQTEHSVENLQGWLKLEENLCSYWLSKSCDGEGTYCSMWGCHPYQHWCPRQWRDQCPSDHLAREEKDRTRRERFQSLHCNWHPHPTTKSSFLKLSGHLFNSLKPQRPSSLPACLRAMATQDKYKVTETCVCVCVCLSEKNKTLSFSTSAHFLWGEAMWPAGFGCGVQEKLHIFIFKHAGEQVWSEACRLAKTHI